MCALWQARQSGFGRRDSFRTKSFDGLDMRGVPGRHAAGNQGRHHHEQRSSHERQRIIWANTIEHACQQVHTCHGGS